jgi:hypothetical protein
VTGVAGPAQDGESGAPRSAAEIEREIGRTRRRIDRTLDALAQRLAPRRLRQKGLEMTSRLIDAARPVASAFEARFRPDPLALGLIGAGIAWLVVENIGLLRRHERDSAADAGSVGRDDEQIPASAGEKAFETAAASAEGLGPENLSGDGVRPAGFAERNPLLLALLGLGTGAALAVLLPPSWREHELIAQAQEDLWQKAEALGHEAAARIRNFSRSSTAPAEHPPAE